MNSLQYICFKYLTNYNIFPDRMLIEKLPSELYLELRRQLRMKDVTKECGSNIVKFVYLNELRHCNDFFPTEQLSICQVISNRHNITIDINNKIVEGWRKPNGCYRKLNKNDQELYTHFKKWKDGV